MYLEKSLQLIRLVLNPGPFPPHILSVIKAMSASVRAAVGAHLKASYNSPEMHRDVHGPLHGLLQPRLQGLRRAPAERERQHVRDRGGKFKPSLKNADYSFSYVICIRMIFGLRSQFSHLPEGRKDGVAISSCAMLLTLIKCVPLP